MASSYSRTFMRIGEFIESVAAIVVSVVTQFFDALLRICEPSFHTMRELGVVAFRKIRELPPAYQASYKSHGLCFEGRST